MIDSVATMPIELSKGKLFENESLAPKSPLLGEGYSRFELGVDDSDEFRPKLLSSCDSAKLSALKRLMELSMLSVREFLTNFGDISYELLGLDVSLNPLFRR